MVTLSTIGAWLASYAGGVLVKLILDGLSAWLAQRQATQTERELGAAQAELGQANATIEAQQAELQAQADAPKTVDDAIARLEEGSA